jgi:hypothetical protein
MSDKRQPLFPKDIHFIPQKRNKMKKKSTKTQISNLSQTLQKTKF